MCHPERSHCKAMTESKDLRFLPLYTISVNVLIKFVILTLSRVE